MIKLKKDRMTIQIKTFQTGCGDCIFFVIEGDIGRYAMMIDCGVFTKEIESFIRERLGCHIELLIVTHIDEDHIIGIRDMLEQMPELEIGELWFNSYKRPNGEEIPLTDREKLVLKRLYAANPVMMDIINAKVSARQSLTLSEAILNHANAKKAWKRERINTDMGDYSILGGEYGKITILSPREKELEVIDEKFKSLFFDFFHHEHHDVPLEKDDSLYEMLQLIANAQDDQDIDTGEKAAAQTLTRDYLKEATRHRVLKSSEANEASIAFVWEKEGTRLLFSGDAAPKIVVENIAKLYREGVTRFEAVKISHHGSSHGTSNALMRLIDAPHYFFTGGEEDVRPHIDAIARVITRELPEWIEQRTLHFNYENNWTDELKKNQELQAAFHYTVDTDSNELNYEL